MSENEKPITVEPLEGEDLNAAQIAKLRKAKQGILNKDSKEER
jgi:hypothetical protein